MKKIIFIFTIILVASCKSEIILVPESVSITLSGGESSLTDSLFLSNRQEVHLETNGKSIINNISKIIEIDDSLLYVFDKSLNQIVVFNYSGKFIQLINHTGHGHGEYVHLLDVTYDNKNQELLCLVDPTSIMYYDKGGNYLRKEPVRGHYTDISVDSNYIYLYNSTFANGKAPNYTVDCIEKESGEYRSLLKFNHEYAPFCSIGNKMFQGAGGIYFVRKFDSNIYQITDGEIKEIWNLDIRSFEIPKSELDKQYKCDEIFTYCDDNKLIFLYKDVVVGRNYILFGTNLNDLNIINKDKKTYRKYSYMNVSDYNIPVSSYVLIEGANNKCAFIVFSSSVVNFHEQRSQNEFFKKIVNPTFFDLTENITINSNPILYIYSLK